MNYDLLPFDLDDVKKEVESGNPTKKNKALSEAYVIAAEGHDLEWFKAMLADHEQAMQEDLLTKQAKASKKRKKEDDSDGEPEKVSLPLSKFTGG